MPTGNTRLLVVDDNQVDRLKLTRILEADGYAVSVCEDGHRALKMLQSQSFDLVLLDIDMPGMDGFELIAAIRTDSALQTIPIIVVSAIDESDTASKCEEAGADAYLSKSYRPEILKSRVASCLEK
jgi:CheY-like chemotaxis protein